MKLLFDANLSPKLPGRLRELFPESVHVIEVGFAHNTTDEVIWEHAKVQDYVIVTADSDFVQLAKNLGFPPKIVRIERCTFRTAEVEDLIRRNAVRISEHEKSDRAVLILKR